MFDKLGQLVDLAAREVRAAGEDHTFDFAAARRCILEDGELAPRHRLRDVEQLLPKAQVGPVDAVKLHSLGVTNDRERQLHDALVGVLDRRQLDQQPLDQRPDIACVDKAHLQVELGKLGLAVSPQVFVAEAARDLEIAFDARHHQQLLQLLRALRQRIKLAGMQAAGHHEIACAFGRALEQDRRLDLEEIAIRQVLADKAHDAVSQHQVLRHARSADIQVAILEPQHLVYFVARRVRSGCNVKRWILGWVEDRHAIRDHLHVARGEVRVAQPFRPRCHRAFHLDDEFRASLRGDIMGRHLVGIDRHLRNAETVAQVDKD